MISCESSEEMDREEKREKRMEEDLHHPARSALGPTSVSWGQISDEILLKGSLSFLLGRDCLPQDEHGCVWKVGRKAICRKGGPGWTLFLWGSLCPISTWGQLRLYGS